MENVSRQYYTADEVMALLGVSRSKAYKLMQECRREPIKAGKLIPDYPVGKVPRDYFNKRCMISDDKSS